MKCKSQEGASIDRRHRPLNSFVSESDFNQRWHIGKMERREGIAIETFGNRLSDI